MTVYSFMFFMFKLVFCCAFQDYYYYFFLVVQKLIIIYMGSTVGSAFASEQTRVPQDILKKLLHEHNYYYMADNLLNKTQYNNYRLDKMLIV